MTEKQRVAPLDYAETKAFVLDTFQRWIVMLAMKRSRGNVDRAARLTGLDPSNFRRLLRRVGASRGTHAPPCQAKHASQKLKRRSG